MVIFVLHTHTHTHAHTHTHTHIYIYMFLVLGIVSKGHWSNMDRCTKRLRKPPLNSCCVSSYNITYLKAFYMSSKTYFEREGVRPAQEGKNRYLQC